MTREKVSEIVNNCNQCNSIDPHSVNWEHGHVRVDNEFRSNTFLKCAEEWDVDLEYLAAHRAQGNGILERIYRMIKRTVARSHYSINIAILLYNESISSGNTESPAQQFKLKPSCYTSIL